MSSAISTITAYGGGLLEVLEQRVRCIVVHRVRAEHEVDAARRLERPHVQVAPQLPDVVDADLVTERLEDIEVGMRPPYDPGVIAEQLRGEEQGEVASCRRRAARGGDMRERGLPSARSRGALSPRAVREARRRSSREQRLHPGPDIGRDLVDVARRRRPPPPSPHSPAAALGELQVDLARCVPCARPTRGCPPPGSCTTERPSADELACERTGASSSTTSSGLGSANSPYSTS